MGFGMYSYACLEAQQRTRTVRVRPGQAARGSGLGSRDGKVGADAAEDASLLPTSTQASGETWGPGAHA